MTSQEKGSYEQDSRSAQEGGTRARGIAGSFEVRVEDRYEVVGIAQVTSLLVSQMLGASEVPHKIAGSTVRQAVRRRAEKVHVGPAAATCETLGSQHIAGLSSPLLHCPESGREILLVRSGFPWTE